MPIARYYNAEQNPDGALIDGVPLRDITDEEWDAVPERLQRAVDACGFYRKTKPRERPALEEKE